ncbi:prepilin peptidase [Demequina lutea]|nr:A24 family peptidase [Demequina lutea]
MYVIAGILGVIFGSFLNVVIWRVPRGKSLVRPGSACPKCGANVLPRDNVPIVSWLLLRGACRACKAPISARYPLVEAGTAAAFVVVVLLFPHDPWAWPAWWYFAAIGIALAMIDLDVKRLPSVIILPSYVVGGVLISLAIALGPTSLADGARATIGMASLWALYALLATLKPGGMGWGDVRLAGVLGGYLGWLGVGSLVVGAFAAFLLGAVWSVGLMLLRGATRKSRVPFGPWMIVGSAVGVVWGESLWQAYLSLIV